MCKASALCAVLILWDLDPFESLVSLGSHSWASSGMLRTEPTLAVCKVSCCTRPLNPYVYVVGCMTHTKEALEICPQCVQRHTHTHSWIPSLVCGGTVSRQSLLPLSKVRGTVLGQLWALNSMLLNHSSVLSHLLQLLYLERLGLYSKCRSNTCLGGRTQSHQ